MARRRRRSAYSTRSETGGDPNSTSNPAYSTLPPRTFQRKVFTYIDTNIGRPHADNIQKEMDFFRARAKHLNSGGRHFPMQLTRSLK